MRFGFELEVSGGARNVVDGLVNAGLSGHHRLHAYHCGCDECKPDPLFSVDGVTYPFKAQADCTADGEFISGILDYGSRESARAIRGLSRVLLTAGAATAGNVGNHVHIDSSALNSGDNGAAKLRLLRLFCRYQDDLQLIAAGGRANVRRYNTPLEARGRLWDDTEYGASRSGYRLNEYEYAEGSYLAWKSQTVEFRLWNSTRAAWRIRTNVGLSHAMVAAAAAGEDCSLHDTRSLEAIIGQYIDGPTWSGILRQRFEKGGVEN